MTGWKAEKEGLIRAKGRKYSLPNDQTGLGNRPAYIQWTRRIICPTTKRPNREADHCHLIPRLRMGGGIPPVPPTSPGVEINFNIRIGNIFQHPVALRYHFTRPMGTERPQYRRTGRTNIL
jgi:hypothetical protein